jgi:hypothetical protein
MKITQLSPNELELKEGGTTGVVIGGALVIAVYSSDFSSVIPIPSRSGLR